MPGILNSSNCAQGRAALHIVTRKSLTSLARTLIGEYKADVNVQTQPEGRTPLHIAVERTDEEMTRVLTRYADTWGLDASFRVRQNKPVYGGARPRVADANGVTPFDLALFRVTDMEGKLGDASLREMDRINEEGGVLDVDQQDLMKRIRILVSPDCPHATYCVVSHVPSLCTRRRHAALSLTCPLCARAETNRGARCEGGIVQQERLARGTHGVGAREGA